MRALGISGLFVAIAACSGSSGDAIDGPRSDISRNQPKPQGDVEVQNCQGAVELARCTSSGDGDTAFVCGDFVQNNTLDVRSGSLRNGGCDRAVDVHGLVATTLARGVTDGDGRLSHVTQPSSLTLGCGRYRYEGWAIDNTLSIAVSGNVVILVEGNVRIASPTNITLAPGARLDLLIDGNLDADNTFTVTGGSSWIGVAGNVRVASPMRIDGALVVPNGHVAADNTLDVAALYAGSLRIASPLTVRGEAQVDRGGCIAP